MQKKIVIKKDGTVTGVYDDAIPFKNMGTPFIKRVSNIEYDNDLQKWVVIMTHDDTVPIKADSREEAYSKEVSLVNENIDELSKAHFE